MTWNVPNILTILRLLAAPGIVVMFLYFARPWADWFALLLFVSAAITDFFDGYLARLWKQQTKFGAMLDPIADKLLVSVSLLMLAGDGTIGGWSMIAAIIILCREILVSGLREFLAELQVSVPVTQLAKWKTTVQLIAIAFLLAGPAGDTVFPYTTDIGLVALWLAAVLTLYTGYDYFRAGIGHLITE